MKEIFFLPNEYYMSNKQHERKKFRFSKVTVSKKNVINPD